MSDRSFAPVLLASLLCAACSNPAPPVHPPASAAAPIRVPDASPAPDPQAPPATHEPLTMPGAELCAAESDALTDARARYEALDALAGGLDPAAPPTAFVRQLRALYQHECLAVGRGDQPSLDLDLPTGIEAKVYWQAGLGMWFRTYLDFADGSGDIVWLLPSRPRVVTADTRPSDPLVPWMCSADPADPCATQVAAWRSRAQRTFELFAHGGKPKTVDCNPAQNDGPDADAYPQWRACVSNGLPRQASLPVGGLGVIEDGWIVVYGRRGHYQYCDELAAFDLSSGAHYRFADCDHRPELDGIAAAGGIPQARIEVETGTIPLELLREFAWVALSVPYVQRDAVTERALGRQLPEGLRMARPPAPVSVGGLGFWGRGSSGHTTLGWLWTRASKKTPAHGELSWPDGLADPADDHAVRLLDFAEQRSAPGCAAKRLPGWILDNLAGDQLPKHASASVDPPSAALLAAMRSQQKRGRCAVSRG